MKKIKITAISIVLSLLCSFPVYAQRDAVRIGFIDTGVTPTHINSDNLIMGKNYVFPECDTTDNIGHGTATAGIVLGSESLEIEGVFEDAQVIPLVVYDRYPSGVIESGGAEAISRAIYDAVDAYGCRVINISMGITEENEQLHKAVEYAEQKGAVIVSAVGNANAEEPDRRYYPSQYPTVIGVGASDENSAADMSQRNGVFVLAEGMNIPCVTNRNAKETIYLDGTSYSCAAVSGICAKIISEYPQITPAGARTLISAAATDIGEEGFDFDSGWGILDDSSFNDNTPLTRGEAAAMLLVLNHMLIKEGFDCKNDESEPLFYGISETNFAADSFLTRAMAVTVLHRLDGTPYASCNSVFEDVSFGSWYSNAVSWAAECNITKGVSQTEFEPDDYVTREQMLTFIARYILNKCLVCSPE